MVAAGASPGARDAITRTRGHLEASTDRLTRRGCPGLELTSAWVALPLLIGGGVGLARRAGLRARRDADARRYRAVWTGPGAAGEGRLTAAVLHELVCDATDRIILVSFAAYTLPELGADLEAASGRGCEVDIVFETEEDGAGAYSGPQSMPFGALSGARRRRWPAEHRAPGALLHAKLLIINGRRALIGSANLSHRALTANLEAGILIEDRELAAVLVTHIRGLIDTGVLVGADQAA